MTNVSWSSLVTTNRNFDPFLHYSLYLFYVSIFYLLIMKILQKQRIFLIYKKTSHHFFASLPNGHTVRLFYSPVLSVDFQRFAKSEKNGDSPFATIPDTDFLILRQILRLPRVRDTWIEKVITNWRKRTYENTPLNSS